MIIRQKYCGQEKSSTLGKPDRTSYGKFWKLPLLGWLKKCKIAREEREEGREFRHYVAERRYLQDALAGKIMMPSGLQRKIAKEIYGKLLAEEILADIGQVEELRTLLAKKGKRLDHYGSWILDDIVYCSGLAYAEGFHWYADFGRGGPVYKHDFTYPAREAMELAEHYLDKEDWKRAALECVRRLEMECKVDVLRYDGLMGPSVTWIKNNAPDKNVVRQIKGEIRRVEALITEE